MPITDIGKQSAETTSDPSERSGSASGEFERVDVSDKAFVKMHPGPTAIEGTVTGIRYLPPAPDDDGNYSESDRGTAGLLLSNPQIPDDEDFESVTIFQSTSTTGDDYKVVNTEDDGIDVYDAGVSVGTMFESDEVEEFDDDEIVLKLSTGAGRSVARTLDCSGLQNADVVRNDDWEPEIQDHGYPTTNTGLIEKHPDNDPNDDDQPYVQPRYARDPQIRPDVEGERVIVMVQHLKNVLEDYSKGAHWATVLVELDDERMIELAETYASDPYYDEDDPEEFIHDVAGTEMLRLAPTMEFEPDDDLVRETGYLQWRYPSDERIEELRESQGVDAE